MLAGQQSGFLQITANCLVGDEGLLCFHPQGNMLHNSIPSSAILRERLMSFWSDRDFVSISKTCSGGLCITLNCTMTVYLPPDGNLKAFQSVLYEAISEHQITHPIFLIVARELTYSNLREGCPKFCQCVDFATMGDNSMDLY